MKKLFSIVPMFLLLLIPFGIEKSSAQAEISSIQVLETSEINISDTYARRGSSRSSSSRSSSSSRNNTSKSDSKKNDNKSGGMSGMVKGLIGGALIGYLLSSMGLGDMLGGFAEIITWVLLGLIVMAGVKWFMGRRKKQEEENNQGFSQNF